MSNDRLTVAAANAAPIYGGRLDPSYPEQQLIEAFELAREALFKSLPEGTTLDERQALLAQDMLRQQVEAKQGIITPNLESYTDMPSGGELVLDSSQSRQFYVGKYIAASQGLGAYPAGLGREAVAAGVMTEQDYFIGIETRLRAYSDIIYAGETGQLEPLVNAEKFGKDQRIASGSQIVTSSGTLLRAAPATSGLGAAFIPVWAIVVVAVAIVAGVTYYLVRRHEVDRTIDMMTQNCQEAIRLGNEQAIKYCNEFAQKTIGQGIGQKLLGDVGQEQILKYLALGGAVYLTVLLLPSLTQSFMSAQDVARQREQERRLIAAAKGSR